MPIYSRFYQVNPSAFLPFNDAPTYISGSATSGERDDFIVAGCCRHQLQGWYNIGGRTERLQAESFVFSVNAIAKQNIGAYSVGIISDAHPHINVSHFLRSSQRLYQEDLGVNYYSGFGRDDLGGRTQFGVSAPFEATGRLHSLSVAYHHGEHLLECSANGLPVHRIRATLHAYQLELRFEGVGVEGPFEVAFEQLYYYPLQESIAANITTLGAWDPQYAPIFVSYSHQDKNVVADLVATLKGRGVRVLGDWDFKAGESLVQRIGDSISRSGYLVVALSENSVASQWVKKELEIALNSELARGGKRVDVLPIILDDCEIPPFLLGKLYVDWRETDAKPVEKLMKTLRSFGRW